MSNKTSCIQHPSRAILVLIREEYVAICNGDHGAAALLAYFEHWTNSKMDALQQHESEKSIANKEGIELPAANLWVYASIEQISFDMLGLYAKRKLSESLDWLCEVGFLSRRNNPIYKWDRTTQYQFEVETVQIAIGEINTLHSAKRGNVKAQKGEMNDAKKGQAIPKIHTKIPIEEEPMPNGKSEKSINPFNAMKDAIFAAFGYSDWKSLTDNERGTIQKAAKQLLAVGIAPEDVPSLYRYCAERFTNFTAMALTNHQKKWRDANPPTHAAASPTGGKSPYALEMERMVKEDYQARGLSHD